MTGSFSGTRMACSVAEVAAGKTASLTLVFPQPPAHAETARHGLVVLPRAACTQTAHLRADRARKNPIRNKS